MLWTAADLRTVGFFAKAPTLRPAWLQAPQVEFVCSVCDCDCAARSPADWIQQWLHNGMYLFDTLQRLGHVIAASGGEFVRYGLRSLPVAFGVDAELALDLSGVHPEPIPPTFARLGFDLCSHGGSTFDSSALSCSAMAAQYVPIAGA